MSQQTLQNISLFVIHVLYKYYCELLATAVLPTRLWAIPFMAQYLSVIFSYFFFKLFKYLQ